MMRTGGQAIVSSALRGHKKKERAKGPKVGSSEAKSGTVLTGALERHKLQYEFLEPVPILEGHHGKLDTKRIFIIPTYGGAHNAQGCFSVVQIKQDCRRATDVKDRTEDAASSFREVNELTFFFRRTRFILARIRYRTVKRYPLGVSRVEAGAWFSLCHLLTVPIGHRRHSSIALRESWVTVIFLEGSMRS